MAARTYKPGEISALGEAIFHDQIKKRVKSAKVGNFVVIDVETGRLRDCRRRRSCDSSTSGPKAARGYIWSASGPSCGI